MEEKVKLLFIAYLEKSISARDELILIQYIKENPDILKEWIELKKLWILTGSSGKFNNELLEKEWNLLLNRIDEKERGKPVSVRKIRFWLPRVAAAFLLGVIFTAAIMYSISDSLNDDLVYTEISTPRGANSKLTLPDGSVVFLNAGSSLKYSNQFGRKKRDVFLQGEAFFDVTSDKAKTFVVHASDLWIKAYGTSFNVKSYPDENTVEATLIEGSLGVTRIGVKNKKSDEVMLEPNQRVVYYKPLVMTEKASGMLNEEAEKEASAETVQTAKEPPKLTYMISKGIDPEAFTSWKDGTLYIDSETLGALAVKLERKYDMTIHFENERLKELKFTGSIENETVEQVMEAIAIAAKINYKINDRDIWLNDKIKTN